jgi:hypothetical protein
MSRLVAAARQAPLRCGGYFLVVETEKGELGVRYQNTAPGNLLKAVSRRRFAAMVERHEGDKYIKDSVICDCESHCPNTCYVRSGLKRGRWPVP